MHPIHDHDPLLLLAVGLAAKRRPAELPDLVAAVDLLQGSIPIEQRFVDSLARLGVVGLVVAQGDGVILTAAGLALIEALPQRGENEERLYAVKQALVAYHPGPDAAPVVIDAAAVTAAIAAHRSLAAKGAKNLLVPKPKPTDSGKARPGQRQRKPLPAKRKR